MIYPIEKKPAEEFSNGNVWDVDGVEGHPTCLRIVILRFPEAHPMWHDYMLSLVHLRPVEVMPAPSLQNQNSSHELMCFALDPAANNQPTNFDSFKPLLPQNLVFQFEGLTDDQAKEAFAHYLTALSNGRMSPDTDYRTAQRTMLKAIQRDVLDGIARPQ